MSDSLNEILKKYDSENEEFHPFHIIFCEIMAIQEGEKKFEAEAEIMALAFGENEEDSTEPWGAYFKYGTTRQDKGGCYYFPRYEDINEQILDYWQKRGNDVNNIYLKARYLGLVYEFNKRVTDRSIKQDLINSYVNALNLLCDAKNSISDLELKRLVIRAINVSVRSKNDDLIKRTINTAINLEDRISVDLELCTWGFCFENLVLKNRKFLTQEQIKKLVIDLESRVKRLRLLEEPYLIEHAVENLSQYYRSDKDSFEVKRVINEAANVIKIKALKSSPVIAFDLYRNLYDLYKKNNMHNEVNEAAQLIHEIGPKVVSMMKPIKISTTIDTESIDNYLDALVEGGFENATFRILNKFIPKISEIREQIAHRQSIAPLSSLFTNNSLFAPSTGQFIATIKSNDQDENLGFNYVQNLEVENFFLVLSFEKLFNKYNVLTSNLVGYIYQSQFFKENAKLIIEKGIEAYFNDNHIVAIHLLIPQLEAAFRNIVELQEASVVKANNIGGMNFILFDKILQHDLLKNCFSDDQIFYFRSILTDQKGWNLRNDVCHGLKNSSEFSKSLSARIIHILLILAQVRF
ncbi:DUF4209 domain-containing protein [Acinetobacter guillouiae]|uniref:DUF4209 domain-containing protein n=1 Tax=Acinetobacter guillouiae TaxID=106649 RepID=UPI003AF7D67F